MRVELQAAYVLHSRPFRETSLIVDVLTPDYGLLSLIAKGVRSNTKTAKLKRAMIQPFQPLLISWIGSGELKNLTDIDTQGLPLVLKNERLYSAFYVNELILKLLRKYDCQSSVYDYYQASLELMISTELLELVLRRFEFTLFEYLGFGINFITDCESGEGINSADNYLYIPQKGFKKSSISQTNQVLVNGGIITDIVNGDYSTEALKTAKYICRKEVASHLGNKPLNSRQLFKQFSL